MVGRIQFYGLIRRGVFGSLKEKEGDHSSMSAEYGEEGTIIMEMGTQWIRVTGINAMSAGKTPE
jgi:hypothetical protein